VNELVAFATNPATTFVTVIVFAVIFGLTPGFANRVLARAYPKEDPRRAEMIAELYSIPWVERWNWVFQNIERVIHEALPARVAEWLLARAVPTYPRHTIRHRSVRGRREHGRNPNVQDSLIATKVGSHRAVRGRPNYHLDLARPIPLRRPDITDH
jgi:hypothetical protein